MDSLDPKTFLTPFLDVIRSEAVTGSVTGMALDSVHKFLAYQILHPDMPEVATAVENLADAVTHARYVCMSCMYIFGPLSLSTYALFFRMS